jgi:hypothetical protein
MYLPSRQNLMSEIEAMISEKKERLPGASCSSNLHKEASSIQRILDSGEQTPKSKSDEVQIIDMQTNGARLR